EKTVVAGEKHVVLLAAEFKCLELLVRNLGKIVSNEAFDTALGHSKPTQVPRQYIHRLKAHFGDAIAIVTHRGRGWKMVDPKTSGVVLGDFSFDAGTGQACLAGCSAKLRPAEILLVQALLTCPNQSLSRTELIEAAHIQNEVPGKRGTLEVHFSHIRT